MSQEAQYVKDGETFEPDMFQWFVCMEQAFCAPLTAFTLHHTDPKRLDLTIDVSGKAKTPRMIYSASKPPLFGIDGNLRASLEASKAATTPQTFYLCAQDETDSVYAWRRLQFTGAFGPIQYHHTVQLPEETQIVLTKQHGVVGSEIATFTLTIDGAIEKVGDWTTPRDEGIPLEPFVQELRKKAAKEVADKDRAERAAQAGKKAWDLTKGIAQSGLDIIGNIHKEAELSAREKKALEARQGTFHSSKSYPQLFEEIWKILQRPIGQFRFSISADTSNADLTAVCSWTEDVPAYPYAQRELTSTFLFEATESGTTVTYEHLLYEVPPGSIFANQLIRTVNSWVKALAEQSPGP